MKNNQKPITVNGHPCTWRRKRIYKSEVMELARCGGMPTCIWHDGRAETTGELALLDESVKVRAGMVFDCMVTDRA